MAAVNLSTASVTPWVSRHAIAGTNWQEFTLPNHARSITVTPDGAARVAFSVAGIPATAETPSDAGAVGSHYQSIAANASFEFTRIGALRSGTMFIAGDTGAINVCLTVSA